MNKPTTILHQVQQVIADQLNGDDMLSAASVIFIPENAKDIDFEVTNALGKQGIVGVVMTPEARYQGITHNGDLVWDLRNITVQIVENVPVNRGLPNSITALDAGQRVEEVLGSPQFTRFGVMNPVSIEQGEEQGLMVCQAKFNCQIRAKRTDPYTYIYFDDGTTNKVLWEGEVTNQMAIDAGLSDTSPTARIEFGPAVTSIAYECFVGLPVTEAQFKSGLVSIGRRAFAFNGILTKVELPDTVQSIAEEAFLEDSIIEVTFQGRTKAEVKAMENYSWAMDSGRVIHCTDGDIVIGSKTRVTYIDGTMREFDIEGEIGYNDIENIVNALSINIGIGVTSISNEFASSCINLEEVTIPDTVTAIGEGAFANTINMTTIVIPSSVQSIGDGAFYAARNMEEITFEGKTVAQVQAMANYSWRIISRCVLHCTDGDITI